MVDDLYRIIEPGLSPASIFDGCFRQSRIRVLRAKEVEVMGVTVVRYRENRGIRYSFHNRKLDIKED